VTKDRDRLDRFHNSALALSVLGLQGHVTHVHSETSGVIDFGEVATLHPGCLEEGGEAGEERGGGCCRRRAAATTGRWRPCFRAGTPGGHTLAATTRL
jgi:hypothetical protein